MINVNVLAELNMQLGECPRWNENEQAWYWVDITGHTFYKYDTSTDTLNKRIFDFQPACFAFTTNGEILLTSSTGLYFLTDYNAEPSFLTHPESHIPNNRFNDGVTTPDGSFIAGTIGDGNSATGTTYRFDFRNRQMKTTTLQTDYTIINGQAFSPDGKWYYVTDTPTQKILKYPYDATTATLGEPELFYQFDQYDEFPDGAAIDGEGNYWIAMYGTGKICVISPEGVKTREIPLPVSQPTMVAFGGKNLNSLVVTTACQNLDDTQLAKEPLAGSLLIIELNDTGTVPAKVTT